MKDIEREDPLQRCTAIRFILQGTVDNNLGPDRLAGPKGL